MPVVTAVYVRCRKCRWPFPKRTAGDRHCGRCRALGKCNRCHADIPVGGPKRGRCAACKELGRYQTYHRDHTPDDPALAAVKAGRVELYRVRAEAGLPLFGGTT